VSILLTISAAFALGSGAGGIWPVPVGVAAIGSGLLLILLLFHLHRHHEKRFGIGVAIAAFGIGWGRPHPAPTPKTALPVTAVCYRMLEGQVASPPLDFGQYRRFEVRLARLSNCLLTPAVGPLHPRQGLVFVTTEDATIPIRRGEEVRLRARVKPLVSLRNPGTTHRQSSVPLFTAALRSRHMVARIGRSATLFRHPFDALRAHLSRAVFAVLPPRSAAMATALSLGERHRLPPDLVESFRRTGVAHLLSVSGLHLGLTTLFVFGLLRFLLIRTALATAHDVGKLAALSTIPIAVSFALVTGLRTPVLRAMIMVLCALSGRIVDRPRASIEAMGLAALILLLLNPAAFFTPGFQLSFSAVAGLFIVFSARSKSQAANFLPEKVEPSRLDPPRRFAANLFLSSVAATAATAPFLLYHFNSLPILGVAVNLIAIPLVGVAIMPILLTGFGVYPISKTVFSLVIQLAAPLLELLDRGLTTLARLPLTIDYPTPMVAAAATLFSLALLLSAAMQFRFARFSAGLGAILLSLSLFLENERLPPGKMTIHFLDVGQGDSALITTPKGRHLLVDAGGGFSDRFDAGRDVVVPALKSLGVSRLHALVLTHPDQDHVGGAPAVMAAFDVASLWENGHGERLGVEGSYLDTLSAARKQHIPIHRTPDLCGVQQLDGITLNVLHPCGFPDGFDDTRSTNDNAIVLLAGYQDTTVAFMGDVGESVEEMLIAEKQLTCADVIKIGHHGSRFSTSTALLRVVHPAVAIISSALFNRFRMPHPIVVDKLARHHVRVFRTDLHGAVTLVTDGRLISIAPTVPNGKITLQKKMK
jgi:competence protein ComEC